MPAAAVHDAAKVGGDADPAQLAQKKEQDSPNGVLAMVQAVRGNGWEAIEHIAKVAKDNISHWPAIAGWLHSNRGADFSAHVAKAMNGEQPAQTQAKEAAAPEAKPATPEKKATKNPIVLIHGLGAGPGSFDAAIPAGMKADGDAVFEVTVPPFEGVEERAKALAPQLTQILEKTGASKLNLIAWSMGGLDARYLISSMGWGDRIASLSMVGTPNKGAGAADKALAALPVAESALHALHGLLGKLATAADATPKKVDPVVSSISTAVGKALNVARELHLAKPAAPNKGEGGEQEDPAVARVNKLAQDVANLANTYNSKLPANVKDALNTLARRLGSSAGNDMASDADVAAALASLSEANAAAFNAANPDDKRVYYQSWAGVADNSGTLNDKDAKGSKPANANQDPHLAGKLEGHNGLEVASVASRIGSNQGKLNDGVVPVESAEWGNYRGTIPVDHFNLVRNTSPEEQKRTGFNTGDFYKQMAEDLATRGY